MVADRPVSNSDLRSLFEAARWAASSYNEQPWSYIVAVKHDKDSFQTILSCLVEANQGWASVAPVLAIGCYQSLLDESELNCHYHAGIEFFAQESVVTTTRSDGDGKTEKSIDAQTGEDFKNSRS